MAWYYVKVRGNFTFTFIYIKIISDGHDTSDLPVDTQCLTHQDTSTIQVKVKVKLSLYLTKYHAMKTCSCV
jgi:hypothetical protein